MSNLVLQDLDDGLLTITLNRPDKRNALSMELCAGLLEAVTRAQDDDAVRAVLLKGEGESFCVGGDVKAMAAGTFADTPPEERTRDLRARMDVVRILYEMPKPSVAALHGAAAGAGLGIALSCDVRLAARATKFTSAFSKVGLSGDFGATWFLTRIAGLARAREMMLTAPMLNADEAFALGLVSGVVDDDRLEGEALALARGLAAGPTQAYGRIKENLNFAAGGGLAEALDLEARNQVACMYTADHMEAANAFVEKRAPAFAGK